jgi:hypothetical protein
MSLHDARPNALAGGSATLAQPACGFSVDSIALGIERDPVVAATNIS